MSLGNLTTLVDKGNVCTVFSTISPSLVALVCVSVDTSSCPWPVAVKVPAVLSMSKSFLSVFLQLSKATQYFALCTKMTSRAISLVLESTVREVS